MSPEENFSLLLNTLPPEQQNQRLDVFFGPMRNKHVNNLDWENKLKFWTESIEVFCTHNKVYTFTLSGLERAFMHNRRIPACFKDVLEELIASHSVITYAEFMQKAETTWSSWAVNTFVKKPLSWTYNKIKSSIITVNNANVEYVHLNVVQQAAKKLLEAIPDKLLNNVFELNDFIKLMKQNDIESVKILLYYLEKEDKVSMKSCVHNGKNLTLLRFTTVPKSLQDVDEQIYILSKEEENLQNKVIFLENKLKELQQEAKAHLAAGNKHMAKTVLRKKRLQEKSIGMLEKNVHNVSTLLHNLEDTAQNHHVFATYKLAIHNLRENLANLNVDNVDEAMAQLGEIVGDTNDITTALGSDLDPTSEDDFEAELADLLAEVNINNRSENTNDGNNKNEKEKDIEIELPSVPNSPNVNDEMGECTSES